MRIFYIDHYDSFSFNLIDWLESSDIKAKIVHIQFDDPALVSKFEEKPCPIVISPGPKSPEEVFQTCELVERYIGVVPILGICLGHQVLGKIAGYKLGKAEKPNHGTALRINLEPDSFLSSEFVSGVSEAATYNSLIIEGAPENTDWRVTGWSQQREIQIIENHKNKIAPAIGIQFHPESFLTSDSKEMMSAWKNIIDNYSLFKGLEPSFQKSPLSKNSFHANESELC